MVKSVRNPVMGITYRNDHAVNGDLHQGNSYSVDPISIISQNESLRPESETYQIAYKRQSSVVQKADLSWYNINVSATIQKRKFYQFTKPPKEQRKKKILTKVNGKVRPGQLLAIMGGSGAGKTTLMNVLTGRNLSRVSVTGCVLINGQKRSKSFSKLTAYVQQDDLFIGTLTVREHLTFQALLRMDKHLSYEDRQLRIEEVLQEIGLKKCENTVIGIPGRIKGISGGEMKRLAFASEVLTNPSLMFCDEPTSGLDSFMAQSVVSVLREMAEAGRTIICTIHQPSSEVFSMFNHILLMAEGRVAFTGGTSDCLDFFASQGFRCPPNFNPADFYIQMLAIVPGKEEECKQRVGVICNDFESSEQGKMLQKTKTALEDDSNVVEEINSSRTSMYKSSWLTQFRALLWRSVLSLKRERMLTTVRLSQTVIVALLLAAIYWQQDLDQDGIMNINGVSFLILTNMSFQNMFAVINAFCLEVPVFLREHYNAMYRADVYFLAKTIIEMPVFLIIPTVFATIIYWTVGMKNDPTSYIMCVVIACLVANTACSFGYMISCISSDPSMAMSISPPLLTPLMLFGGFFLNAKSIPSYFVWIKYVSWFLYGNEALVINQWKDIGSIACKNQTGCITDGAQVLKRLNFDPDNFNFDLSMLVVLLVVFRILAYLCLLLKIRGKK